MAMNRSFVESFSLRIFFFLLIGFLAFGSVGCDSLEDDDSSDGGAGTTTTAATTTTTTDTSTSTSTTPAAPAPAPAASQGYPNLPSGAGFVYKPVSEGDHNLVVLIPRSYGNAGVAMLDGNDALIEQGRYVGRTNGDRPTYRFSRQGGAFPTPSHLRVGSSIFNIPNPGIRYD